MSYNEMFKILIIGDSGIGKTDFFCCLYLQNYTMKKKQIPTNCVDYGMRLSKYLNSLIKLNIIETSGAPFYLSVARSFYKGSQGIFLCFDIKNERNYYKHQNNKSPQESSY